ncbi:cytochrome P450 3A30-like [Polypterus senegalus]|uniref:cytochrome P450 3A30-like n=1 Tax=Polypterus senegalus TaxID=55291 RepID=UPI001963CDFC|nr:cytochrome P450 3A30-like [Polypterus senegalus]
MEFLPGWSAATWTLLVLFFTLFIIYGLWPFRFFKKLGIPGPQPLPFIGTFHHYRKGFFKFDAECFQKYGKFWGIFDGRQPVLGIMDTSMIKTILVKECYSVFTNRRNFGLNGPLYDAVSIAEDDIWKRIRHVLSPTFTSGRLKEIFPIVKHYADNLQQNAQKISNTKEPALMKDLFGSYSLDVVGSCSFSVDIDSINNPKDPFVANLKKMVKFSFFNPLFLLCAFFPFLIPLFVKMNLCFFPSAVMEYFYDYLRRIKAERTKNVHDNRVDFLQLMVDSQMNDESESEKGLTDHEILSQSMIFMFAGYETTSTTLSFMSLNLATHPDVMKKVQEEIDKFLPNKAPLTYDALMEMEYLDMMVNESLRLHPPGSRIERVCKKTIELNGVTIPRGTVCIIPAFILHRDPEHFPDPEAFKPERFSKEMKESMDPYAFLPFGSGPRNCIGMRFALLIMKAAIVQLLQNFDFVPTEDMQYPAELSISGFLQPVKPITLKLVPRAMTSSEE